MSLEGTLRKADVFIRGGQCFEPRACSKGLVTLAEIIEACPSDSDEGTPSERSIAKKSWNAKDNAFPCDPESKTRVKAIKMVVFFIMNVILPDIVVLL